jgi:excisionase family DNA binding protein
MRSSVTPWVKHIGPESFGAAKATNRRPKFYTPEQVAEMLCLSLRSVRRLIDAGKLRVHRFGRSVRIAEADLLAFIALHRVD